MQFWEEIINTALLGTDKRAVAAAQLPEGLAGAAERIAVGAVDKEEQFLQLAAVAVNYRQSGVVPLQQEGVGLPTAPEEELPYCSGRAVQVLKEILEEGYDGLVEYWLKFCVRTRRVVVPDLLPVLLNKAVNHVWMQELMAEAGGKRGEWIRAFNPSWQFGGLSDDDLWQTGTAAQRTACLRRWRVADPAKARMLMEQTWAQENANGKVELLRQLNGTVVAEDAAWLEGLLSEKSQKVKEEALGLLSQLPGSSVVEKNWEIVRAAVYLKKERALLGMVSKTSFVFDLKDPALLAGVPPVYWESHLSADPVTILGYFQKEDKKLLAFLAAAIGRFKDKRWAEVFIGVEEGYYPEVAALWEGEWSIELARVVLKYTARQPYQYPATFYKEHVARIPAGVVAELEKFAPPEPHLKVMWDKLSEQIRRLAGLKEQVLKAFN
jgi:hypothetical protein